MNRCGMNLTSVKAENINAALANLPNEAMHLRPIWEAVRDHGLVLTTVLQGGHLGRLSAKTKKRPRITIIGDDMEEARGPEGFPKSTIWRLLKDARSVFLMSGLRAESYGLAVTDAVMSRHHVIIVETRHEYEIRWLTHIKRHAPHTRITMVTPNVAQYSYEEGSA